MHGRALEHGTHVRYLIIRSAVIQRKDYALKPQGNTGGHVVASERAPCSARVRAKSTQHDGSRPARIVIVDDHPIVRRGLVNVLRDEPDVEVVGEAGSGAEACRVLERTLPHAVVLDLALGEDDGMELARAWLAARPDLRILVLSMQDAALFADRLLAIGAMGFVPKNCSREEFLLALRTALRGNVYITEEQRARVQLWGPQEDTTRPDTSLSERETAVLRLLATGMSAAAIAAALDMAPKTVYSHRRNISAKLGIGSGVEMLRYAMQWFRSVA
jgi:DNA-binding NarL/FixJ family response regulator